MIPLPKFMGVPAIESKAGLRRIQHTRRYTDGRIYFAIGRYLDRSKYIPAGPHVNVSRGRERRT